MGGFTRWMEKVRQGMGFTPSAGEAAKDWRPSSNARNYKMIEEARAFATQLKLLHRDLTAWEKATDVGLSTLMKVLNSNLPKAHDDTPNGVHAVDTEDRIVGTNVNIAAITSAQKDVKDRMRQEVLHPLEQWLAAYRTIKERNRECEGIRLDLDRKRRQALELADKCERTKSKPSADAKVVGTLEMKSQTEADKVTRLNGRFMDVEAEVFNALLTLIRDTSVLREYCAGALIIMQRCCQDSYLAFDLNAPPPLPALPPAAMPTGWNQAPLPPATSSSGAAATSAGGIGPMASMRSSMGNGLPPGAAQHGANPTSISAGGAPLNATMRPPPGGGDNPFQGSSGAPAEPPAMPPPAWYNEAKKAARAPSTYDEDSDDDAHGNPFKGQK